MDIIISYLRNDFLKDLEAFYQSQGRQLPHGTDFTNQQMLTDFANFLQLRQAPVEKNDNPGFSSLRPDQQPPPSIVDENPPTPFSMQPPSTFVPTTEPSPGEQPPPSNTK